MRPWSDVLPEFDPTGDLGIWVAARGEPGPPELRRLRTTVTVAGNAQGHALRLVVETEGPRPATAASEECGVVFDGALFNRGEFRDQLRNGPFPLPDDASLVLQAYLRWGRDLFPRIKGIFALVIWDSRNHSLFCARDRTGFYPLFYAEAGPTFLVSTSINALLRYPGVASTVDRVALAGHLVHHWGGPEETYFTAVGRLMPGCLMEIRGALRCVSRYWDPVPPDLPFHRVREDELERFDALLGQAVTRCLELGRSGIYLSGGIDSVGVATAASDTCRANGWAMPVALMIDFSEFGANESALQTAVATSLGLPHVVARYGDLVDPETALEDALGWSSVWPWPIPNLVILPYLNFGPTARAEGCRVILTGEGGDECLAVHPHHGAELLRTANLVGFTHLLRVVSRSHSLSLWRLIQLYGWVYGLRPLLGHAGRRVLEAHAPNLLRAHRRAAILTHAPDWVAPDPVVRRGLKERIARDVERDLAAPKPPGIYQASLRSMLEASFETDFERSRRTGLRVLHPYWDADVVDFVLRTPPALLSIGGRTKGLVRRRLAQRFPGLGYETHRKFMLPEIDRGLILSRARIVWEKQGGAPTLGMLGVVDEARLGRAMEGFFARPRTVDRLGFVWDPLNLEAWARTRVS